MDLHVWHLKMFRKSKSMQVYTIECNKVEISLTVLFVLIFISYLIGLMKTTYGVETSSQTKIDRKECVVCDGKYRYVL